MANSRATLTPDIAPGAGYDPILIWLLQWRGYLQLELRQAQTDAKDHERAMQAAQQRAMALKAQLAGLPET